MNLEEAILYAHQRMREIGKQPDQYHFEPVRVYPTAVEEEGGKFTINAYNELYIIINPDSFYGIFIIADNSAFNSDVPLECGVQEFTGKIIFTKISFLGWNYSPASSGWGYSNKESSNISVKYEFLRVVY